MDDSLPRAREDGPREPRAEVVALTTESLTVEHTGEPLSRYEVEVEAATGKLRRSDGRGCSRPPACFPNRGS